MSSALLSYTSSRRTQCPATLCATILTPEIRGRPLSFIRASSEVHHSKPTFKIWPLPATDNRAARSRPSLHSRWYCVGAVCARCNCFRSTVWVTRTSADQLQDFNFNQACYSILFVPSQRYCIKETDLHLRFLTLESQNVTILTLVGNLSPTRTHAHIGQRRGALEDRTNIL